MHAHRLGNAQLVRVGLRHRRGRTDWDHSLGYGERRDLPWLVQIFSRAHECVGLPVSTLLIFAKLA